MATTKSTSTSRNRATATPRSKPRATSEAAVGKRAAAKTSSKKTTSKKSSSKKTPATKASVTSASRTPTKPTKAAVVPRPTNGAERAAERPKKARTSAAAAAAKPSSVTWNLRLYVAGDSPRSRTALANLERLCESRLNGDYQIEVIDLTKKPHLAKADQILAVPTLIRSIPEPMKRIIGDLTDADRALVALDLQNAVNER